MKTITIVALLTSGIPQGRDCALVPPRLTEHPRNEFKRHYENNSYGYAVDIPNGLIAYDTGAEAVAHHGFGIPLGDNPQSYLMVYAEPNSLGFPSAAAAAKGFLDDTRKSMGSIVSSRHIETRLGRLPATRVIVTYSCGTPSDTYVADSTFALGRGGEPLFQVSLWSRQERYPKEQRVLAHILKSWSHLPPK